RTVKLSQDIRDASLTENILIGNEIEQRVLIDQEAKLIYVNKNTYNAIPFTDDLISNIINTELHMYHQNQICMGTSGAIYVYNADFSIHRQYQHHPEKKSGIPRAGVNSFFEDKDGMIWVSFWEAGLFKLDTKKDTWTSFPKMGNRNNPYKVLQD